MKMRFPLSGLAAALLLAACANTSTGEATESSVGYDANAPKAACCESKADCASKSECSEAKAATCDQAKECSGEKKPAGTTDA